MRRTLVIALATVALLVAGCGISGGEDSTATTEPADDPITAAQLEEILPTAADIGRAYTASDSDDDDDDDPASDEAGEEAMEQACPEAAALGTDEEEDEGPDDEVSVEFEDDEGRGVEVELDPTPQLVAHDEFNEIIEAIDECSEITFEDEDLGSITMQVSASPLPGHGDIGAELVTTAEVLIFQIPVTIDVRAYLFLVDGVGVSVTTTSGLDQETFETIPADDQLLAPLSEEMQSRVEAL